MIFARRLALLLALAAVPALSCVVAETQSRDLPPREEQPPPPRRRPPPPPPRDEPPPPPPRAEREPPPPPRELPRASGWFRVPPDRAPARGLCRIWYDELPPDRQPPEMDCGRAHRVAERHGGRVIWAESGRAYQDGTVATTEYGRVDLRGVPPDRMPPPGYCRVWLDGVPPDRQPSPAPCPDAEREARRTGGRLLYMPSAQGR
jgi:hypothetical protein